MKGATCRTLVASWLLLASSASAEERDGTPASPASDRPAATQAPRDGACVPPCRTGYVCIDARCVTACNPPCSAGERCTERGECEPRVEATSSEFSTSSFDTPTGEQTPVDASPETPRTRRNSTGMMVTGIVLAGIGGVVALSGMYLLAIGDTRECTTHYDGTQDCYGTNFTPAGLGMTIGGSVVAVIGLPLIVMGAKRVPVGASGTWPGSVTASFVVGQPSLTFRGTW